jgi:hypothetical protein
MRKSTAREMKMEREKQKMWEEIVRKSQHDTFRRNFYAEKVIDVGANGWFAKLTGKKLGDAFVEEDIQALETKEALSALGQVTLDLILLFQRNPWTERTYALPQSVE